MDNQTSVNFLSTLNTDIAQWEQTRDTVAIAELDHVLSPLLLFRRADGSVVGKREFMDALRSPSPFAARKSQDVVVTVVDDRALVTLYVTARKSDGSIGRYRNVRVFFRDRDRWHLEIWFNDDVTRAAEQF